MPGKYADGGRISPSWTLGGTASHALNRSSSTRLPPQRSHAAMPLPTQAGQRTREARLDGDGRVDAANGKKLWSHNDGQGHNGGIISYMAKGKQYVAVMTGWGSLVGDGYGDLWGEPYKSMPKDSGVLKVFALQ